MKKLLAIVLMFSVFLLSGCNLSNKGVSVSETGEYTKITLDNFEGNQKIQIKHDNPGECSLYCKTNITDGSLTLYYDEGLLWETKQLFFASVGSDANSGTYIDSSVGKVTIIIESSQPTSGEILFCFSAESSPFD